MKESYQKLLNNWTKELNHEESLLTVVNKVRDIPYQFIGSRDIDSMLTAGAGTCNAKHMLLKKLIEALGYKVRFIIDKFNLSSFLRGLDTTNIQVQQLQEIALKLTPYYHTYIQILRNNVWISIDISFDSALTKSGFTVAPDWDGIHATPLPHETLDQYIVSESPDQFKKNLLIDETEVNKVLRQGFFTLLNTYLIHLRTNI